MKNPFVANIVEQLTAATPLDADALESALSVPPNEAMGDYAFPCFALAKQLRKKPNEIAADLAGKIVPNDLIREARPVGPYVNFFVQPNAFIGWVLNEARERGEKFGHSDIGKGRTVIVEYSSPNIAKHLGVHHIRSTMIGHALCMIYSALGYRTVGVNFLGDWGTQFGILMAAYKKWGGPDTLKGDAVGNLNELYVRFNEEAKADPALREEGRAWFKKLEEGDPEAVELWRTFREVSLAAFQKVYTRLGVQFDVLSGESAYEKQMPETIRRLEDKGLAKIDDGALIVDLKPHKMPPVLLRKSDGATLYDTRDVAAAEARYEEYKFAKMVYVVGGDQKLHFRQIFRVLEMMGHEWAKKCEHVDFGIIRLRDENDYGGSGSGTKMSTRKGTVIMLKDVLAEAVARVGETIAEKNPDLPNKDAVAEMVGVGAVVFNDLKRQRTKDVDFDWDTVLSFEGDTGPYVQYAHVRLCGILRKYGKPVAEVPDFSRLDQPEDLIMAKALTNLSVAVRRAADANEPSVVAQYLLDLCAKWSNYYHKHQVVGEDASLTDARIALVDAVRQTIANGLALLGVKAPEEM